MTVGSQLKQTIVGLKGVQATMRIYAQQARHEKMRSVFHDELKPMNEIINDLEGRLQAVEMAEPQYRGF